MTDKVTKTRKKEVKKQPIDRKHFTRVTKNYIKSWDKRVDKHCEKNGIRRDKLTRVERNKLRPQTKLYREWGIIVLKLADVVMPKQGVFTIKDSDYHADVKTAIIHKCTTALATFNNKPDRCAYSYFYRAAQNACIDEYKKHKDRNRKKEEIEYTTAVTMGVEPKDKAGQYKRDWSDNNV